MIKSIKYRYHNLISDTKFSEILTGSAWALTARVFVTIIGLIFSVLVARLYGAETVGVLAVINSFLMIATIFTLLGTNTSILRYIPEHLTSYSTTSAFYVYRKTQYIIISISIISSVGFYFGADLIANKAFSKPNLSSYFALSSFFIVFQSIMKLNTEAIRGLRLIKTFAFILLLPQTFNLLFLVIAAFLWPSPDLPIYSVLFGFVITSVISFFIVEYFFGKRIKPNEPIKPMSVYEILSSSMPMLMVATMMFFIGQTGILMLGILRSEKEVGYYAIAVKLASLTIFILNAVNSMAGPQFSELFHSNMLDDLFHVAKKSAKLIFFTTTPILVCLIIFGHLILKVFFGNEFSVAYPPLALLVMGQFVNAISGSSGMFLNMTGHQKIFQNIMILAAAINVGLNLWLIPLWGINGAAFTAMVSLCFWNIAILIYMKIKFGRTTGYIPLGKQNKKMVVTIQRNFKKIAKSEEKA